MSDRLLSRSLDHVKRFGAGEQPGETWFAVTHCIVVFSPAVCPFIVPGDDTNPPKNGNDGSLHP